MGYQQIDIPAAASSASVAYSFRTVTFKAIAATDEQSYDLTDLIPVKANGDPFDATLGSGKQRSTGSVRVRKMSNIQGNYDTEYWYYSTTDNNGVGWYEGSKTAAKSPVAKNAVTFKKGEGLLVTCTLTTGAKLQVSGEVELTDTSCNIPAAASSASVAYCFSGNTTPVELDINDITPLKANGDPFDATLGSGKQRSTGSVRIRKMLNINGNYDTEYWYYSTTDNNGIGWYEGSKTAAKFPLANNVVKLSPGEGVLVTCTLTTGAKLGFKKPID